MGWPPNDAEGLGRRYLVEWIVVVGLIVLVVVLGSYLLITQIDRHHDFCSYATRGNDCPRVTRPTKG